MTARIVTFLNQKGGVGKTSSVYHLGGTLARMGRRVLLIDNDPQASLTQGFWGPDALKTLDRSETIAAVYAGDCPLAVSLVRPVGLPNLALVPGSRTLALWNGVSRPHLAPEVDQRRLAEFLDGAAAEWEFVLIDCPPNLQLCSWAALVASTAVVVPLQAEDFGAQGVGPVNEEYRRCRAAANPGLRLAGYLITMFDGRLDVHAAYEAMLRAKYGPAVFAARMPLRSDFKKAIAHHRPIAQFRPRSDAASAAALVADELLDRLARPGSALPEEVPCGEEG